MHLQVDCLSGPEIPKTKFRSMIFLKQEDVAIETKKRTESILKDASLHRMIR